MFINHTRQAPWSIYLCDFSGCEDETIKIVEAIAEHDFLIYWAHRNGQPAGAIIYTSKCDCR